jgi:hypothetical protein
MPRKFAIVLFIGLASVAVIACLGVGMWAIRSYTYHEPSDDEPVTESMNDYQAVPKDRGKIASLEGNAEIKLPSSAREIYAYTTGFQEIYIQVRFTMDAGELAVFLENTLCRAPLADISTSKLAAGSGDPSWWEPEKARHLETCQGVKAYSSTASARQTIYVDMTDPAVYIVYVSTSTY